MRLLSLPCELASQAGRRTQVPGSRTTTGQAKAAAPEVHVQPQKSIPLGDGLRRNPDVAWAQEVGGVTPKAWSAKRERQYEHIKESLEERGEDEDTAEEIAARTVNKERARAGEAKEASKLSLEDISSGRRGGLRSHKGAGGRTRDQLYEEAKRKNIKGRSSMNKAELEAAVDAD